MSPWTHPPLPLSSRISLIPRTFPFLSSQLPPPVAAPAPCHHHLKLLHLRKLKHQYPTPTTACGSSLCLPDSHCAFQGHTHPCSPTVTSGPRFFTCQLTDLPSPAPLIPSCPSFHKSHPLCSAKPEANPLCGVSPLPAPWRPSGAGKGHPGADGTTPGAGASFPSQVFRPGQVLLSGAAPARQDERSRQAMVKVIEPVQHCCSAGGPSLGSAASIL